MNDRMPPSALSEDEELATLAVFPLPRLVLFPGANLPLHIFEPRYREMMRDCLSGGRRMMAIAQLKPGFQQDYEGQPPIHDVAGVGRFDACEQNSDGTFDIQLTGVVRAWLDELPMEDKTYRRARATRLREREPGGGIPSNDVTSLFSLASQVSKLVREREPRFRLLAEIGDPPALLIDKVADQFVGDPDMRQHLLEIIDVNERMKVVTSRLAHLHLALMAGENDEEGGGEPTLH
jgi:Lon protease-like protein